MLQQAYFSQNYAGIINSGLTMTALPEKPHQPRTLRFPKRSFGKKGTVQVASKEGWFDQWNWLHYDEPEDKALCHVCANTHGTSKSTS